MDILENYLKQIQKEDSSINEFNAQAAMIGLTAGMLAISAFEQFKEFMSKANRQCFGLDGSDKAKCVIKMRTEGTTRLIAELNKRKALCKDARNPQKCAEQMDKKINKQKEKLVMYGKQMSAVSM